ncbi:MAG: hypothetical protein FJ404_16255 [Verrucomicrobia bacterium]|nr:hypothetical protein [Verrucomicrobiota bacterium]
MKADDAETILFEFQTATHHPARQIVNDGVLGGVSSNRFSATPGVDVFRGQPPLDLAKVTTVGFLISEKQAGPSQLEVNRIKATSRAGRCA